MTTSHYGLLFPEYWDGPTGRLIQKLGGKDATILGAYLTSNRRANMIGLYRLPPADIAHDTPLAVPRVLAAFEVLGRQEVAFADYDPVSDFVWVREMARIRVGIRDRLGVLNTDDNRVGFINRLYAQLDDNPFLGPFFDRYRKTLHLNRKRTSGGHHNIKSPDSPSQGPAKPVNRSVRTSKSVQITDQDQGTDQYKSPGAARRPVENLGTNDGTFGLYCVIAREAIGLSITNDGDDSVSNVAAYFKDLCAERGITYNSDAAAEAIEVTVTSQKARRA